MIQFKAHHGYGQTQSRGWSIPPMACAHVKAYQVIWEKSQTKNWPSFSHNFSVFNCPTINDICLNSKNIKEHEWTTRLSWSVNHVEICMKSRVIFLYWLSHWNSIYLFIIIFILCYSCSPSKYGRALNCQNLYVKMGSKDGWWNQLPFLPCYFCRLHQLLPELAVCFQSLMNTNMF